MELVGFGTFEDLNLNLCFCFMKVMLLLCSLVNLSETEFNYV